MKTNIIPFCSLQIFAKVDLEEVANMISKRVLGGVKFVGRNKWIRDEAPTVFSEQNVFGSRFILMQDPDEGWFFLECETSTLTCQMPAEEIRRSLLDISQLVAVLLEEEPSITVKIISNSQSSI